MVAFTTTAFAILASTPAASVARKRRRRITPEAGRALEILGHAIEYLTDEFVHKGGALSADNPQLKAVQLLMALNRQIYYECPEVPSLGERLRSFLRIHRA
ncbi:MAG: hypothetical protein ABSE99_01840 [Terracidiphilus sp.]|jgi:hypothetical protein